mgnify:CR=1 FL=1
MEKLKDYMKNNLLTPGHRGCPGCGMMIAVRHVINAAGPDTILVNATGCLEVVTSPYPESAWRVPWVHSLFENAAAVASGVVSALKAKGNTKTNVIVFGGDGGTIDIGFGLLSGMFERGDNILYVCFDNEGYQNTGAQASGSTIYGAATTTTPAGAKELGAIQPKKNMPAFAVSQGLHYVATSSVAYPVDIEQKVKRALSFSGPKYLHIFNPCPVGWGFESELTIQVARLAVTTGLFPVIEVEQGEITKVLKTPEPRPKVEEYLKSQARFKHLFRDPRGKEIINHLQKMADENIEKYGLCPKCEEHEILTHYKEVDNLDTQ